MNLGCRLIRSALFSKIVVAVLLVLAKELELRRSRK